VYQFASVARRGRLGGQVPAERVETRTQVLPEPQAPARGAIAGEWPRLLAVDLAAVAAVAVVAGAGWLTVLATAVLVATALGAAGLYRARLQFSVLDDLPRAAVAVAAVVPLAMWAGVSWAGMAAPLAYPLAWPVAVLAGVVAGRTVGYRVLRWRRRRVAGEPTIVVGSGDVALRLAEMLTLDRGYGLAPVGLVGAPPLTEPALPAPLLGPVGYLEEIVDRYRPRSLVFAFPGPPDGDLVGMLRRCRRRGVTVFLVPRLYELPVGRTGAELVGGIPLLRLRPDPAHLRRWAVKRAMDIAGALFGLIVLAPVLAACALAVRFESRRNGVLFRQERISRDGKPFTIMKFRSLTPATNRESQVRWNIDADSRIGPVGKFLRVSSLDELPQLLNVLRGDMSLVGPRPERPFFVDEFQRAYGGYADRHRVPAGITGWAQIHGLRGDTSIEERVRFDNYYIENWSLGLDLKIILRTVGSMLSIHRV
jgi:exopolysaccharide biosynthesis polyprenyl glycosylphosphotransferase